MAKKIVGIIMAFIGLIIAYGAQRFMPDLKPLGFGIMLILTGGLIALTGFLNRPWNWKIILGLVLNAFGAVGVFATVSYFPDFRPLATMIVVVLLSWFFVYLGIKKTAVGVNPLAGVTGKTDNFKILATIVAIILFIIPILLFPQINWQHPKDPAAVMILSLLTAIAIIYVNLKNHPSKKPVTYAGLIAVINFILIPVYESGVVDWLGKFYRMFVPLYQSFDAYAEIIEYTLIALTVLLVIYFSVKKTKVREYGQKTLYYFIIQITMAIFFFEMLGLPAGFLAGNTTRSDLLVTDTNAVMSTFGMIFIAVVMYIAFQLFPFYVTPILAGLWWVFWKPWLLHHPDPAAFTSFSSFFPAAAFLFFTGIKRIALPMIIMLGVVGKKK